MASQKAPAQQPLRRQVWQKRIPEKGYSGSTRPSQMATPVLANSNSEDESSIQPPTKPVVTVHLAGGEYQNNTTTKRIMVLINEHF